MLVLLVGCAHDTPATPDPDSRSAATSVDGANSGKSGAVDVHEVKSHEVVAEAVEEDEASPDAGCMSDAVCDDGDPATKDWCIQILGECRHVADPSWIPCTSVSECADSDPCTTGICTGNHCVFEAVPNCCDVTADCDDGKNLTEDYCVLSLHQCGHFGGAPADEICDSDASCTFGNPCVVDACVNGVCVHTGKPKCCLDIFDCDDGLSCTFNKCIDHLCVSSFLYACDDGQSCTMDTLTAACACNFTQTSGCGKGCGEAAACNDKNPCTLDACTPAGQCSWTNRRLRPVPAVGLQRRRPDHHRHL